MSTNELPTIISAVAGSVTTALIAAVARSIFGIRRDVRQFMAEHLYLLRVADWTKANLGQVMDKLGLNPKENPPELPDWLAGKR